MKAARYHGNKDIRIEEVPVPEARAGECLVEVEWCGICGSDLHEYVAGPLGYPTPDRPHPLTGDHIPLTLGHEFCGRLKSVPAGSKLRVGQAVMVDPHLSCHACRSCTSGNDHLCEKLGFMGCTGGHGGGGLSQFAAVEEAHCLPLPDGLSLDYAAVIEPLAVCYHAAKVAGVPLAGLDVLIVGGGPIGIALIPILKAHGVNKILVSEPTAKRKEQAKALVDRVIDPISENVGDISRDLTGGKGVDVAFDCAGVQPGLDAAFAALKYGGLFVNIAVWEKPVSLWKLARSPAKDAWNHTGHAWANHYVARE